MMIVSRKRIEMLTPLLNAMDYERVVWYSRDEIVVQSDLGGRAELVYNTQLERWENK